jgi:hypothetical protein
MDLVDYYFIVWLCTCTSKGQGCNLPFMMCSLCVCCFL